MRLLVLGGTRFLGRHVVDAALARGHAITVFTRALNPLPTQWGGAVEHRVGDRDPRIEPGLRALEQNEWDAAIDTSGYAPRVVAASARLLASRGALKAACEREVAAAFGARACFVRPGLIIGPHDPTDRFAYWVARFAQPTLLGDRAPQAVVPNPPERPLQFIDARDLAAWMVDLSERRTDGTFNATSPDGRFTMGALVDALTELARATRSGVAPAWIDERTLIEAGVAPWVGLPLWIAQDDEHGALMQASAEKALAAGLAIRPLVQTLVDTAAWLAARPNDGAWKNVLSADAERAILKK